MAGENKQTEIIELQAKVSLPSQEIYDALQKLGYFKQAITETGKATGELGKSVDSFGGKTLDRVKREASDVASIFGVTLPRALSTATVAMFALDLSKQIAHTKEWERAMVGSTLATEEWARQQQFALMRMAWSYGVNPGEVEKMQQIVGALRVPEDQINKGVEAIQTLNAQFQIDKTRAAELWAYAIVQQGKSAEEATNDLLKYAIVAKEMGVIVDDLTAAMAAFQKQHQTIAQNVRPESLAAFIKEFQEVGPKIFEAITAAPYEKQVLWERLFGLSEKEVQEAPERLIAAATRFVEERTRGLAGTQRKMAMAQMLQSILGLDQESIRQVIEEIETGKSVEQIVEGFKRGPQQKAEQAAKELKEKPGAATSPGAFFGIPWPLEWTDFGIRAISEELKKANEPLTKPEKEKARQLLSQATPEQRQLFTSIATRSWENWLSGGIVTEPQTLSQLEMLESLVKPRVPAPTYQEFQELRRPQLENVAPAHAPVQRSEIKLQIEVTGDMAEYVEPKFVPAPYDPAANIGLELITKKGRSVLSWKRD